MGATKSGPVEKVPIGSRASLFASRVIATSGFSPRRRAGEAFLLLLFTHFVVDCFSSALPTVQPLLAERFSLNLTQAGLLGGIWMFSSALMQLPFGLISDRLQSRYFTVLSPLVAAFFLTSLGLAPGFAVLAGLLLVGGMGSASYHPHSTSQASRLGGERRGISTAVFIAVGTAGLGLGPLYLTAVIERFGFEQLWYAAVPVAVMAPVLLWRMPRPIRSGRRARASVDWTALREQGRALLSLYVLVVLRSIVQFGFAQFLSLYMVQVRGEGFKMASVALAVFFLSTSVGSFVGGAAADRYGRRAVILASFIACVPLLAAFVAFQGWVSVLSLFAGGVVLLATIPVNVVMAQELAPSQAGTTSALMMGFGWGTAGIVFVPVAGWLADSLGLDAVFWGLSVLPLLGVPIALTLPGSENRRQSEDTAD